jgi:hypothetical protein
MQATENVMNDAVAKSEFCFIFGRSIFKFVPKDQIFLDIFMIFLTPSSQMQG